MSSVYDFCRFRCVSHCISALPTITLPKCQCVAEWCHLCVVIFHLCLQKNLPCHRLSRHSKHNAGSTQHPARRNIVCPFVDPAVAGRKSWAELGVTTASRYTAVAATGCKTAVGVARTTSLCINRSYCGQRINRLFLIPRPISFEKFTKLLSSDADRQTDRQQLRQTLISVEKLTTRIIVKCDRKRSIRVSRCYL